MAQRSPGPSYIACGGGYSCLAGLAAPHPHTTRQGGCSPCPSSGHQLPGSFHMVCLTETAPWSITWENYSSVQSGLSHSVPMGVGAHRAAGAQDNRFQGTGNSAGMGGGSRIGDGFIGLEMLSPQGSC